MDYLKRFDDGIARGEAALATAFLLSMIVAASLQAIFRNIAGFDVGWANAALESLTWIDPFLQKGTLWLAFLGASLATKQGRHIGVDLLPRLVPRKGKLLMRGITGVGSSIIAFFLARAFWSAVLVNAEERPATMEVYGDEGSLHVCDAAANLVADAGLEVPNLFCGVRSALGGLGVPVETPAAALQLIVPVMFVVMAIRLMANGIGSFMRINKPPTPEEEAEELARTSLPADEPDESTADDGQEKDDAGAGDADAGDGVDAEDDSGGGDDDDEAGDAADDADDAGDADGDAEDVDDAGDDGDADDDAGDDGDADDDGDEDADDDEEKS